MQTAPAEQEEREVARPTYGNFRKPRNVGLWNMSMELTLTVFGIAAVTVVLVLNQQWLVAVVVDAIAAVVVGTLSHKDVHGVSIAAKWMERVMFKRAKRAGRNLYRSGPIGVVPSRATPLPGMLAGSRVSEHVDSFDRGFALVHHADRSVAVVMSVTPPGIDLVDTEQLDNEVAQWGEWLAMLGNEVGVVQASVVVETSPDSGQSLARHIATSANPDAPQVARHVMEEIGAEYRTGAAQMRAWVTVSFLPSSMASKKRSLEETARDIGGRLTGITQQLKAAGAGAVHLMGAHELARFIRTAYDPAAADLFDRASSMGEEVQIGWEDAGPIGAQAEWDFYRHDSGVSRTWVVSQPPQGVVHENVLEPLLRINSDIERKRVALLYRPIEAARTGDIAEQDQVRANNQVNVSKSTNARALREAKIAARNASEEAAGAGIEDFVLIVTATTMGESLDDASSVVRALAASSKLPKIRVAYGAQDSAFALALPLGLRPSASAVKGL